MKQKLFIICLLLTSLTLTAQVSTFPYTEGFEATFTTGTDVDFIPNWKGDTVTSTSSRIFRDATNQRTGTGSLAVIPISSYTGDVILKMNFSSLSGASADFWARSVKNSTGTRPAIVKFYTSIDGGTLWSAATQIGTNTTFQNNTTPYAAYNFIFPANTDGAASVFLRIEVAQSADSSGTTARVVFDDFGISGTTVVDLTPPSISNTQIVSSTQLDVKFSEVVSTNTAQTITNFSVDNAIGNPVSAVQDLADGSLVHLIFATPFTNGSNYILTVNGVSDLAGNILNNGTSTFTYSVDLTPPQISSTVVITATTLDVIFNENVGLASAQTTANYSANNGLGIPTSAVRDASNNAKVRLTFATAFTPNMLNTLSVSGVADVAGNVMSPATANFTFATVQPGSVVINEIMADPDPVVGLPNVEYLELYNTLSTPVSLSGWKIQVSTTNYDFTGQVIPANGYLLISTSNNAPSLSVYGQVAGIFTAVATLTNSGTSIILKDNNTTIIDKVIYSDTWYQDNAKKDGGWSLERVDPTFTCLNVNNWKASVAVKGGTPGAINSIAGTLVDNSGPVVLRAAISGASKVIVYFNEPMDSVSIKDVNAYTLLPGIGNPLSVAHFAADYKAVELTAPAVFTQGTIYTVQVANTAKDCIGNAIAQPRSARFAIADTMQAGDLIINEILFNPYTNSNDFVEVYNRSNRILDLNKLSLANANYDTGELTTVVAVSAESYLIFPGDFIVLSASQDKVKPFYKIQNPNAFLNMTSMPSYNNANGYAVLVGPNNMRVDEFRYTENIHFPLLTDVKGISLERVNYFRASNDSTNWHSAAQDAGFATPGYRNSQYAELISTGGTLAVEPQVFSPDNDGVDDVVNLVYTFNSPGMNGTITIYDSRGRQVRALIQNQPMGTSGAYSWDGITDEREKARVGIYVILLEAFDGKGETVKVKKSVVLATKL